MEKDLIIHYHKKHCQILINPKLEAIELHRSEYVNSQDFREACDSALEAMIERNYKSMLANNTELKVIGVSDQEWFNTIWFPKAFDAGFRFSAIVLADNIFVNFAVKNLVSHIKDEEFNIHYFNKVLLARLWLENLRPL